MLKLMMSLLVCFSFLSIAFADEAAKIKSSSTFRTPAQSTAVSPSPSANTNTATKVKAMPQSSSVNAATKNMAAQRNMVFVDQIRFTRVSGDVYNWQADINNVSGAVIANAVLMPSKYINGAWAPMGDQQTKNLNAGNSIQSGTGSMAEAVKFKIDILAKRNGESSPLEVVGSKTVNFSAQTADLASNITISNITITPFDNRFQWKAMITNNNNMAFNAKIIVSGYQFFNNQWDKCGETSINQLAAGASSEESLTFWRDPTSTQFKIVLKSNGQVMKESSPIVIEPINAVVAFSNVTVIKQGTIANWSATVTNSGNIQLSNLRVKTYQRAAGGQWVIASNAQNVGTLATGAGATASNMFSFGSSTQFKVEAVASSFSQNYGDIIVGTQEVNF